MKKVGVDQASGKDWTAIEPLGNNVCLTDPQHPSPLSKSILMPDTARKGRYERATVYAVGPDVKTVKVGDVIFIPEIKGHRYEPGDGRVFLFYPEDELLAKLENK